MKKNRQTPKKSEEKLAKERLILIDGNAIIHRSYHALPPLMTKKGELVNAVYGFASTLLSVIDKFKPDYIAAAFDLAGPTFRHEQFESYKANRVKADDELYAQIPRVKEVVRAFNIPIYEKPRFEADDIIGTVCKQIRDRKEQIETIIVTGDLDTLQLIDGGEKVYTMRRGLSDSVIYDKEKVIERFGIRPDQMIDFKGLRGDPSDNIPGVKGIGEKTATELLKKYGSIAGVYENIDKIKGAVKEKLLRDRASALLSRNLATIRLDAPIEIELEKTRFENFDREKIVKLFNELEFYSLVKRLPTNPKLPASKADGQTEAESTDMKKQGIKDFKYYVADKENIDKLMHELEIAGEISLAIAEDAEKISGIAISHKTGRTTFFPACMMKKIQPILENPKVKKIGYDLKEAYKKLWKNKIELKGIEWDVMIAEYVLNPGEKISLEKMVLSELSEEISFETKKKVQLSLVPSGNENETLIKKTSQIADYAFKLKQILEKRIVKTSEEQEKNDSLDGNLGTIFRRIEMPLVRVLAKMELEGIIINTDIFVKISEKIKKALERLEKEIHSLAGGNFNINSTQQLSEVLFSKLKLPTDEIKKIKTGFSTAAEELKKLRNKHKIIQKIEEYRELFKLKTTYLDTLPTMIDENSRLHTTFNQAVTATGRLSSTEPNLQNIPVKNDLGQLLRTAFVASPGFKLVSADYSQIDLRAVAHVSKDKKLTEAFHRGDDIHRATAAEINKVTLSKVTEKMRRNAKALNFGIIYGMGAFGFAQSAGITREEAQKFIDAYMENFSGVATYMKETRQLARKNGYVETLLGRRRNIPEINSPNFQIASGAERMAINMPIQGLAADIMKLAMIAVSSNYKKNTAVRILLQIHDEIILEVKTEEAESVAKKVKELMENVYPLSVPLIADVKIGDNWGEI